MLDRDSLVVAMTLVPGLYSRNKMFALFRDPEMQRARSRAAQLRGVVRQLAGAHGEVEVLEFARGHEHRAAVLAFRVATVRFVRRLELTEIEAACVAYLCGRAGVSCIHPSPDDRALLDAALRRLASGAHLPAIDLAELGETRQRS